jgi:hypothetical protein
VHLTGDGKTDAALARRTPTFPRDGVSAWMEKDTTNSGPVIKPGSPTSSKHPTTGINSGVIPADSQAAAQELETTP